MKKFLLIISILLTAPLNSFAQTSEAKMEIPIPDGPIVAGQTTTIEWKMENFPQRRPIFIYIQNLETERFKLIGVGHYREGDEVASYEWEVPANFVGDYRFRMSTRHNGKWFRKRSTNFRIRSEADVIEDGQDDEEIQNEEGHVEPELIKLIDENDIFASRYQFGARLEPWEVRRVSIVNDTQDDGFDVDNNESSSVIKRVLIRYKNEQGQSVEQEGVMNGNQAVISNMNFYIPASGFADLEIYADVIDNLDQSQTGLQIRLGIQDRNNSVSTFDAIGLISSDKDNTFSRLNVQSAEQNESITVRNTDPFFGVTQPLVRPLVGGQNIAYEFSLGGSSNQAISLGRMVFDVNQNKIGNIDQVEFFRNGQKLTPGDENNTGQVYLVWDTGGTSCFAHTTAAGAGTGMNCNGGVQSSAKLIVAFSQEEIIADNITYRIRLRTQQVNDNASLQTKLAIGDQNSNPNTGGPVSTVGSIYNGTGSNQLFSNASDFIWEASSITDRNFVWSDQPFNSQHQYASFNIGMPPTVNTNGSADFTTGYLLGIDNLPEMSLVQ